jgi:hypothetical protein
VGKGHAKEEKINAVNNLDLGDKSARAPVVKTSDIGPAV